MKNFKYIWLVGIAVTLAAIIIPLAIFLPRDVQATDDPWAHVPVRPSHTDHTSLMEGPYGTGSDVTQRCLECHEDAAYEVMNTVHWTWESEPYYLEGRDEPITVGKKTGVNNFCIGIQSNWAGCTSCHAGYGWEDAEFDFSSPENVDCLVCHDNSGTYRKGPAGIPLEGVDLAAAAQSVATPTRDNCGSCHFNGGGGNGVKHADLDEHLLNPPENLDVHMGRNDFQCVDCHQTDNHEIGGQGMSVSLSNEGRIYCTDCHQDNLHEDDRINDHVATVACQTCHIPAGAIKDPTKVYWDWSTAGQDDIEEDAHTYLKIKGSFVYESEFVPEYAWYSGVESRYIWGDPLNENGPTVLNPPKGDINDPEALIYPFKIHRAKQPYDEVYNYLLQPKTYGEGGFWTEFDWEQAMILGSEAIGLPYSGEYGFIETEMYWPVTHLVAPVEEALQCVVCHSDEGRLDWNALGYPGDPMEWGGRYTK